MLLPLPRRNTAGWLSIGLAGATMWHEKERRRERDSGKFLFSHTHGTVCAVVGRVVCATFHAALPMNSEREREEGENVRGENNGSPFLSRLNLVGIYVRTYPIACLAKFSYLPHSSSTALGKPFLYWYVGEQTQYRHNIPYTYRRVEQIHLSSAIFFYCVLVCLTLRVAWYIIR